MVNDFRIYLCHHGNNVITTLKNSSWSESQYIPSRDFHIFSMITRDFLIFRDFLILFHFPIDFYYELTWILILSKKYLGIVFLKKKFQMSNTILYGWDVLLDMKT